MSISLNNGSRKIEAKRSEKIEAKRNETKQKKYLFISFAKRSEKEAKWFMFRFEVKKIRIENGTPYAEEYESLKK